MAAVTFQKISGVLIITQTAGKGKYYASTAITGAKFSTNTAGDGVNITIAGDDYAISLTDLTVNGQIPATMTTALVLLNSLFST